MDVNGVTDTVESERGTFTTDPNNGTINGGARVKAINAINSDRVASTTTLETCGEAGGTGWQPPE